MFRKSAQDYAVEVFAMFDQMGTEEFCGLLKESEGEAESVEEKAKLQICCAACGHGITEQAHKDTVANAHEHKRTNPAGLVFVFGIFARADGCAVAGQATVEHSWFADHAWEFAICGACGEHLGWRFTGSSGAQFFALIFSRLVGE